MVKTLFHTIYYSSFRVRNETYGRVEGFEPQSTGVNFTKYKKDAQKCASSYLLTNLAGCESLNWHPLLSDFVLLGRKLERLGFTYYEGQVTVAELIEVLNYV